MVDVSATLEAKGDQVNADDLMGVGRTITIRITRAKIKPGEDQPWDLHFEGSDKVYRPSKGMRRIMAEAWGLESDNYVGQRLKLFRDPEVKFGKDMVGGIRIGAMTGITARKTFVVAVSRNQRRPFPVDPLPADGNDPRPVRKPVDASSMDNPHAAKAKAAAEKGSDHFRTWYNTDEGKKCRASGAITEAVLVECRTIASGADALGPKLAADEVGKALADADPMAPTPAIPTDDEIQAQIDADHAREMARMDDQP